MEKAQWLNLQSVADEETRRLLGELPAAIRAGIHNIPIVFERVPSREMIAEGLDADLLGLFVGDAYAGPGNDALPAEILLFLVNLWDEAGGDVDEYRRQVRITLLHEIGHYLGLDEDGLAERDLE
jgi:predicted Zn-dependent protease with MMP-like domain